METVSGPDAIYSQSWFQEDFQNLKYKEIETMQKMIQLRYFLLFKQIIMAWRSKELKDKVYCHYLDDDGEIKDTLTYGQLFQEASAITANLQKQGKWCISI